MSWKPFPDVVAPLLFLFTIAACGPADAPGVNSDAVATPEQGSSSSGADDSTATAPYAQQYPDPPIQNIYRLAVDACFYDRPQKLASDLGVTNDPGAIAREYAMRAEAGPLRDAAYAGCLEGLSAPGAGEERQFGR